MFIASHNVQPHATLQVKDARHRFVVSEPDIQELAHMSNIIIGQTVRDLRKQAHMSETAFANKLDRKRGFVRLVESGQHPLTLTEFKSLAEALGVSHMELASDVFRQIDEASHTFTLLY